MSGCAVIAPAVVEAFDRLRVVALEAASVNEIIQEIDVLERTVSLAMGGLPPETRPVIPAKDERWG